VADLRRARPEDSEEIRTLIISEMLPAMEVDEWIDGFWVLEEADQLVGCAGIEKYGEAAVLRSVVTALSLRGTGEGVRMTRRALDYAREIGAKRCYLFTMGAVTFFPRFGFERCTLDDFEPSARESWQWRGVSENEQLREMIIPMRADL
jgi:amino-acid N-acetyltransferase